MGCGSWTSKDWDTYKIDKGIKASSSVHDLYKSRSMDSSLNPKGIKMRESCDSDEHPNSNAIILGLDVTGSMGHLAEVIAKGAINDVMVNVMSNDTIVDPQIMMAAIGDSYYDEAPLQVSQFESDIRIAEQLGKIWFEGGGGGNEGECYSLLYYFAARHTSIDCMNKRNKKGIIFTIGDEPCVEKIPASHIEEVFGDTFEKPFMNFDDIYNEASKMYDIYHIAIEGGRYNTWEWWKSKLTEKAICIGREDTERIPKIIIATLELKMGKTLEDITASMDSSTALVVTNALRDLATGTASAPKGENKLVEFE